ncbi:MAG: hypothetical protein QXF76_01425 [Candidatus Anstonellales archaeon]
MPEEKPLNEIKSEIILTFNDEKLCEAIFQGLIIEKTDYERSKLEIKKIDNKSISIKFFCRDKSAFFATNNGITTMLRALL